jgi:DNA-directed RNA polymerase specialized sigma subunit
MKCFEKCTILDTACENRECRYSIENKEYKNCTIIAAKKGPMTLQQIGDIFGVTRMRICQLEKKILKKISNISI